jgi:hypothetical protein
MGVATPRPRVPSVAAGVSGEPCSDERCGVLSHGFTNSGGIACPACGRGGANLSIMPLLPAPSNAIVCGCGHSWEPAAPEPAVIVWSEVLTTAEIAECTCPEFCERDHDIG